MTSYVPNSLVEYSSVCVYSLIVDSMAHFKMDYLNHIVVDSMVVWIIMFLSLMRLMIVAYLFYL